MRANKNQNGNIPFICPTSSVRIYKHTNWIGWILFVFKPRLYLNWSARAELKKAMPLDIAVKDLPKVPEIEKLEPRQMSK